MIRKKLSLLLMVGLITTVSVLAGCQGNTHQQKTSKSDWEKIDKAVLLEEEKERNNHLYFALPPVHLKGIYVTGNIAGLNSRFDQLVTLADETEINAMVIDIKDDRGEISFHSSVPFAQEIGANVRKIRDIEHLMYRLNQHNIFPIARVVVFKDPIAATKRPNLAVQHVNGGVWKDRKGLAWLDPYNKENWDYIVDLSIEAAELGFKEIQLDYIRFPSDGATVNARYPAHDGSSRTDAIEAFLDYFREKMEPYNVDISVDIFGMVTAVTQGDMGIGQEIMGMSTRVDYICPMVYPSHYIPGNFGLKNPDRQPYETVYHSMKRARDRVEETGVKMRPWLQDFNLQSVYTAEDVRAQIQATYDVGVEEWILWNAANRYTRGALEMEQRVQIGPPVWLR